MNLRIGKRSRTDVLLRDACLEIGESKTDGIFFQKPTLPTLVIGVDLLSRQAVNVSSSCLLIYKQGYP